jgi:hypothetical protein
MAGTLFGLSLSQRVDLNGTPAVGWLLYLYQANTSTPVNSYQDTALTVLNPWPIAADAYGMMRQFWLADGSYRARATSADGSITYFDQQTILALGASTGAAPSGGVDATAIYQTGDVMWLDRQGTRTGWVRDNGRTIGSATSGAAERANADVQPLFEFLWNNFSDAICPVVSGRGGSSLADWGANKQITTPDKRGYISGGLDDMGNSAAARYAGVPVVSGSVTTAGSVLGEATHVTTSGEMPAHTHVASVTDPGHTHTGTNFTDLASRVGGAQSGASAFQAASQTISINSATTGVTVSNANTGGGTAHNNVQKTVLGTFYRKL